MKPVGIIIFILTCSLFYVMLRRYKEKQNARLEKSKVLIQNIVDHIPPKMQKVIVKSKDTFPAGMIKLASTVADSKVGPGNMPAMQRTKEDKMIEAFEDIKDIRYGKIGASNIKDGITVNKWIKVSSFTLSGAWTAKGLTMEVYPRTRLINSSRQTLVAVVRNINNDVEEPYISLTTHNQSTPGTRLIKDVRFVRTSGTGITNNVMELWIQFDCNWTDTSYVMYYLYNFATNDFVATVPQAQVDKIPGGQAWGINERIEPQNGKTTIMGAKGSGWSTAVNVNAPQEPESLYSLHFGDGTDLHGRQTGMGYIKNQPNRIWGNTRGTLATHIHQDDDLHIYSSGWNPLFSVKGGSGNTYVKGNMSVMGGANVEGKVRFRHAGANGDDNSDPYYLEKVNTSGNNNSLRMTINDDSDESFQIWGNSCGVGDCGGPGAMQHYFGANGTAIHKGTIQTNGQINTMGRTNYPPGWGGGVRSFDIYASGTNAVGDEAGNVKAFMNRDGDAYFSRNTIVNKLKLGNKWTMSGVGDAHGNDDWLRLFGNNEGGYYGGFAAGRLWTGQGYLAGSDKKMKENIKKVDKKEMLGKVSKLNGYLYNLKEDKDKKQKYGVIAQEIAKEFPEMVEKGPNGLLAVDYNQLIGVLLESIKELNEKCSKKK